MRVRVEMPLGLIASEEPRGQQPNLSTITPGILIPFTNQEIVEGRDAVAEGCRRLMS